MLRAVGSLQQVLQIDLHLQIADPRSTVLALAAAATIAAFCSSLPLNCILGGLWAFPIPTACGSHHRLPLRIRLTHAAQSPACSVLCRPPAPPPPVSPSHLCLASSVTTIDPPSPSHLRLVSSVPDAEASCSVEELHDSGGPATAGELRPRQRPPSPPPHGDATASSRPRTAAQPSSASTYAR
jgi:hypothetical protein